MTQHLIHGTSLCLQGKGFLIQGESGAGKSDLALRLLYEAGATLIADDYTLVEERQFLKEKESTLEEATSLPCPYKSNDGPSWILRCPEETKGLLEVRGLDIISLPHEKCTTQAPFHFIIHLYQKDTAIIERCPDPQLCHRFKVPLYAMGSFEPSLVAKVSLLNEKMSRFSLL